MGSWGRRSHEQIMIWDTLGRHCLERPKRIWNGSARLRTNQFLAVGVGWGKAFAGEDQKTLEWTCALASKSIPGAWGGVGEGIGWRDPKGRALPGETQMYMEWICSLASKYIPGGWGGLGEGTAHFERPAPPIPNKTKQDAGCSRHASH